MEKLLFFYKNVKYLSDVGILCITPLHTFWISYYQLKHAADTLISEDVEYAFYFAIALWKKSEKSAKSPRVRLTYEAEPAQPVLEKPAANGTSKVRTKVIEFKDGRDQMEQFCFRLHSLNTTSRSDTYRHLPSASTLYFRRLILDYERDTGKAIIHESDTFGETTEREEQEGAPPLQTEDTSDDASDLTPLKRAKIGGADKADASSNNVVPVAPSIIGATPASAACPTASSTHSKIDTETSLYIPTSTAPRAAVTISKAVAPSDVAPDKRLEGEKQQRSVTADTKPTSLSSTVAKKAIAAEDDATVEQCKADLLKNNNMLRNLYSYLVGDPDKLDEDAVNIISPADFWKLHSEELAISKPYAPGTRGTENFLSSPPTFEVLHGSVTVLHGSNDMIKSILKEDEKIFKLHQLLVEGGKIPSEIFWERFFQSAYFHEFVGKEPTGNRNVVEEIGGISLGKFEVYGENPLAKVHGLSDSLVDLVSSEGLGKKGFGTVEGRNSFAGDLATNTSSLNTTKSLLERFNKHSMNLMDASQREKQGAAVSVWKRNDDVSKELELEDLKVSHLPEYPKLDLSRRELYAAGSKSPHRVGGTTDPHGSRLISSQTAAASSDVKVIGAPQHPIGQLQFKKSMEETGRHMFIFNTKLCQTERLAQIAALDYDPHTVASVAAHQTRVTELLQHFYTSKVPEEQKREKIMSALEATKQELIASQENAFHRAYGGGSAKALYAPIIEMINIARNHDNRMKSFVADLRANMKSGKRKVYDKP